MTTRRTLSNAGMIVGLVLLASSLLIPRLVPSRVVWSPAQADHHAVVSGRLHQMTHEMGHLMEEEKSPEKLAEYKQQLADAQKEFDTSRAALDRAARWQSGLARALRWSGIGLLIVSVMAAVSPADDDRNVMRDRVRKAVVKR